MSGPPTSRSIRMTKTNAGSPTGRESYGDGVLVVVVGVAPHQGVRESRTQGEGEQVTGRRQIRRSAKCKTPKRYWVSSVNAVGVASRSRQSRWCWSGIDSEECEWPGGLTRGRAKRGRIRQPGSGIVVRCRRGHEQVRHGEKRQQPAPSPRQTSNQLAAPVTAATITLRLITSRQRCSSACVHERRSSAYRRAA